MKTNNDQAILKTPLQTSQTTTQNKALVPEESEHQYRDLVLSSPAPIAILKGPSYIITTANNAIIEIWGKGTNIIGKALFSILPEWEEKGFQNLFQAVFTSAKPSQALETAIPLLHNGKLEARYYNFLFQPVLNLMGEVEGIGIIATDVTSQVLLNQKLKKSEEHFRKLMLQAPVAICIFRGPEFTVEIANEEMLRFWGRSEEEVINKPVFEAMPELVGQGFEELLINVLKTGERFSTNEVSVGFMKGGKIEKVFINLVYEALYDDDGSISGVLAVANVITDLVNARKRMEVQSTLFTDMLMAAPGFVCTLLGPDHVYNLVNAKYQSLFGNRKIKGLPIKQALPELEGQGFYELLDNVYQTGKVYLGIDVPIILGRDDTSILETRYFNLSYQPMYDEDRTIFSILVFGYEVTEQVIAKNKNLEGEQLRAKELEEKVQERTIELIKANDDLKKMNEKLESFTYVTSHDLQEPLRKIQTFGARLLDVEQDVLSDKSKEYFKRIMNAANRMQTLINDLLSYATIGIKDQHSESTNLNKIVAEVQDDLMESIAEKSVKIEVGALGEAAINPFHFRQIMTNLIANAIKFSITDKQPHIIINSKIIAGKDLQGINLLSNKNYLHISISDNGIGFNPEYKEKIFDVFQRLHSRQEYAGTGIGLSIVKKIVENYNGVIAANSVQGEGTTFNIYLPAA